jgi:glycosyltransferase involved in cell wall biosynthesis
MKNLLNNNLPLISVVIACRNEEKYIEKCLNSLILQDYPKEKLEILVVDGISKDKTREIIEKYVKQYSRIKILDNHKKFTPFALNIGIKNSKSEVIALMGAHTRYREDYLLKCVKYLKEYNADNVGGILITVPGDKTLIARAIALCFSHPFGVGNSYFRIGFKKPRLVDTVFGGCYRKEVFNKIGLFNENLIRSGDMEFNLRLKKAGGKILLAPDIVSYYYPSPNLKYFFIHNFEDGIWAIYPLKFIKMSFSLRHYIPLIFVLTLPVSIWFYIPVVFYFSSRIALKEKDIRYFFIMPIVFSVRHLGYGFGSVWGLIKLIL